ncbi:MAG: peptidoglycan DD-metalloendopeptidase family protein [Proteobacteria bacterium]|nr:peptidoglycan DD-metalloendopeptidase family protein [Pseudomonadota bacterium]
MSRYPQTHIRTAALVAAMLAIVISALPARDYDENPRVPIALAVSVPISQAPVLDEPEPESESVQKLDWQELTIKRGDSLARIFNRVGLPAADLQSIVDLGGEVNTLRRIFPGTKLHLQIDDQGVLHALRYSRNKLETLLVTREGDSFHASVTQANTEQLTSFQVVTIDGQAPSLYLAGKRAGLSDNILMQLSYIFQWDISFALDMRQGDTFALLYEEIYAEGEKVKDGDILAATFVNMGKSYTAVKYRDQDGRTDYYSPEGLSMRKAFMRDPVHFSHVSSSFNLRRLHPIHKRVMPHRGIDYAANQGTPVVAAGDGKVITADQNSASGKFIVLQHGQQYTTKYLHLSRFASGISPGKSVRQGQTIGYVGATGWATAPHLHYEFLLDGVHRNPRTVRLPKADPIPASDIEHFRYATTSLLLQLAAIQGKTGFASLTGSGNASE